MSRTLARYLTAGDPILALASIGVRESDPPTAGMLSIMDEIRSTDHVFDTVSHITHKSRALLPRCLTRNDTLVFRRVNVAWLCEET